MKAGWELKRFGDVCALQNGFAFKSKLFKPSGVPVLRISSIQNDSICDNRPVFVDPSDYKENLNKYKVVNDDLLIAMSGATTGKVGFNRTGLTFLLNQRVGKFEPSEQLDKRYLYYYLSTKVQENLEISAGTAQPNLSTQQIKEFQIPLPPLEEQKRIVSILDEAFEGLDRARGNAEANLKSSRELFANLLNATFENNNEQWTHSNLGTACRFIGGSQPSKANFTLEDGEGLVRLVQIRDYKSDKNITFIPRTLARRFCTTNDVMIGRYGPPLFQILRGIEGAYNVALMKAEPDPEVLSTDYLYFFLRNSRILKYIINASNRAAGQIGLNKATIEPYPIAYPTLVEQNRIVVELEKAERDCKLLETKYRTKLQDISDLRQSLLQKAFAGELT